MFELCYKINDLMKNYYEKWFICGGWAIDLFIGKETRKHNDIEIGILRKDQNKLWEYFGNYEIFYVNNMNNYEKILWDGEYKNLPIHEFNCKIGELNLEILLNECDENNWIFRRDNNIKFNLNEIVKIYENNIPYLIPELVLLYKLSNLKEKDKMDFKNIIPYLSNEKINWLNQYIENKNIDFKIELK